MSAIPEDIRAKARRLYDSLGRGSTVDEDAILKALLAERTSTRNATLAEAAEIADSFADGADCAAFRTNNDIVVAEHRSAERAANRIADAIRALSKAGND